LVSIGRKEVRGFRADERRTPTAGLIACPVALDLDDIGAEVAEKHGAVWAGESLGELNNADGMERRGHGRDYSGERQGARRPEAAWWQMARVWAGLVPIRRSTEPSKR